MAAHPGPLDEVVPFFDQLLPREILRMRLARKYQLHRPLRTGEQTNQPLRIVQQEVGTLVGSKAPREANRQHLLLEDLGSLQFGISLGGELPRGSLVHARQHRLARLAAHLPQLRVGQLADVLRNGMIAAPTLRAADLRPQGIGRRRVPRRHMNAVGDRADGHLRVRPARKQRPEDLPTHLAVQLADAVHLPAAAQRKIRHIERLRGILRVPLVHMQAGSPSRS